MLVKSIEERKAKSMRFSTKPRRTSLLSVSKESDLKEHRHPRRWLGLHADASTTLQSYCVLIASSRRLFHNTVSIPVRYAHPCDLIVSRHFLKLFLHRHYCPKGNCISCLHHPFFFLTFCTSRFWLMFVRQSSSQSLEKKRSFLRQFIQNCRVYESSQRLSSSLLLLQVDYYKCDFWLHLHHNYQWCNG